MSDFAQGGPICTLQRLNERHLATVEARTVEFAKARPVALILPCHARDLQGPALRRIVGELCGAEFVSEVVFSVNGCAEDAAPRFDELPLRKTVLCDAGGGKGENIAAALRHLLRESSCAVIATQDCDVASFRRVDLARLCLPLLAPELGFQFAKSFYSRATDRLYGRVSRLVLAPLLQALAEVGGPHPLLEFLRSFRFPLSGECAFTREVAGALEPAPGWAFEIGQLCQLSQLLAPSEVCQVEGGDAYEHRHHIPQTLLAEMAPQIRAELLRQCARVGLKIDATALLGAYQRAAEADLRRWHSLARMNDLAWNEDDERSFTQMFAERLRVES